MARRTKDTLFDQPATRAETLLDKTTRAANEIIKDDKEERETKTMRLRKARLEREAFSKAAAPSPDAGKGRKTSGAKAPVKSRKAV